jgi:hypothetical protein
MKGRLFSGRSWFRKKKKVDLQPESPIETREPKEVFSVMDYVCVSHPLAASNKVSTAIDPKVIASFIYSIFSKEESAMNTSVMKYFQEHGAESLEMSEYSFNDGQGYSARVSDGTATHMVLVGSPAVVARSAIPFHEEIAESLKHNPEQYCIAIDGIVYAAFRIDQSWL